VSKLILNILLSIVFFLIAIALVLILTPPCSLSKLSIFTESCLSSDNNKVQDYHQQVQYLEGRIAGLQREILNHDCSLNSFVATDENEVDATRLTEKQVEGFQNSDLTNLAGCWEFVGSSQEFYPVNCQWQGNCEENRILSSNAEYCFDQNGNGQAKTDFAGGSCRAPTTAKFNNGFNRSPILNFTETKDAPCDPGVGYRSMVARSYACNLSNENRITCTTTDSRGAGSGTIVLKRKSNGQ
jgi:hypothetical protein